ncbi:MAG: response regulator [Thermodesulfobacteriota bacterium]
MSFLNKTLSIRVRATLLFLVIVLVSLSVATTINIIQTNKLIAAAQTRSAEAIAHGLAQAAELPVIVYDERELDRLLGGFLWNKEVQFLLIVDDKGKPLARRIINMAAFQLFEKEGADPSSLVVTQPIFFQAGDISSGEVADEVDLEPAKKNKVGEVVVALSLRAAKEAQQGQAVVSFLTAALAAAFSIFLVFRPVGLWSRRVDDLVQATDRMTRGDFSHRIGSGEDDEIGKLALAFETMRKAVGDRDKELRELNNTLHDLVLERTGKLENAMVEAQTANEAKSSFLANMSHEIRTPMNGIIGMISLALNQKVSPKLREYLLSVRSSAESLLAIINDILDFSKIEAGKLTVENVDFQLHQLFDKLSDLFSDQASARNIELVVGVEPGTPSALRGDPLRLEQIFINLLGNALKFTDHGEIVVHATVDDSGGDEFRILFSVSDTGVGISEEQAGTLFDPFTQADGSTTREYGGTGLGLSICKRLVELLGGKIWVESKKGAGTTVFFTVRFTRRSSHREIQFVVPATIRGLKILVVEDNEAALTITTKILESFHFQVESARSCAEAQERLLQSEVKYDLLLVDWRMPEVDGLECIERISTMALEPQIPIIMMTAFGGDREMILARDVGVKHFLTKPVKQSLLFDTIMDIFNHPEAMHTGLDARSQSSTFFSTEHLAGTRVLVAEDNRINQNVARELLESGGIIVEIANNGREAVHILQDRGLEFDAVLMDVQMPVVDGLEATRLIRKNPVLSDLPVIAVTAHAMQGDREKCMQSGMNDYVAKPITPETLFSVLTRWTRPEFSEVDGQVPNLTIYPDGLVDLPETLPGLHVHSGVTRMAGNIQSYMQMLKDLVHFGRDVERRLGGLVVKDPEQAIKEVHTLKGTAANLSAHRLQNNAMELEQILLKSIGGNSDEKKSETTQAGPSLSGIRVAVAQLAADVEVLGGMLKNTDAEEGTCEEPLEVIELVRILRYLHQLTEDFDPTGEEFWLSKKGCFRGLGIEEEMVRLENHLRNYNFEKAGEFVVRICDHLSEEEELV